MMLSSLDSPLSSQEIQSQLAYLAQKFQPRPLEETQLSLLERLKQSLDRRAEELARTLSQEGNRPLSICSLEVKRSIQTISETIKATKKLCKPEPLDFSDALQGGKTGISKRFTYGPLFAIVPYNFPLNLGLHKIAPALAASIPFVCKPPLQNLKTYTLLHEALLEAGFDESAFAFLFVENEKIESLLQSIPFPLISFTGSKAIGMQLRRTFWDRKVILELGGTAVSVFLPDYEVDKVNAALSVLCKSAFAQAGQSCISLQHLFISENLKATALEEIKTISAQLCQNWTPNSQDSVLGPLVNPNAAAKAQHLIDDARKKGFTVWQAPKPPHSPANFLPPTLIVGDVGQWLKERPLLLKEEAFAPLLCLQVFPSKWSLDEIADATNQTEVNIHASVWTETKDNALKLQENISVRTLLWNEAPSWRADSMPYGGFLKICFNDAQWSSGIVGNEGPFQTLYEYTMDRLFILS